jgi:phosphonate transport system permease protein
MRSDLQKRDPAGATGLRWWKWLTAPRLLFLAFLILVIFSWPAIEGSDRSLSYWSNLRNFLSRFLPPDFSESRDTWKALVETFRIAVMATFFATLLSVPIAAASAQNIAPRLVVLTTRILLSSIRSIPSLIWALLAVAVVGANSLAGVIALTFYGIGYLGKFFGDAFESVDPRIASAQRRIGADAWQAFQYGLWPHAQPLILSQSLWLLEYNIRSATIIGYVGAGGLGVQLLTYQEFYQWDKFAAVLVHILVIVIVLDLVGERIRAILTRSLSRQPVKPDA